MCNTTGGAYLMQKVKRYSNIERHFDKCMAFNWGKRRFKQKTENLKTIVNKIFQ
jgi:hypothetical protein